MPRYQPPSLPSGPLFAAPADAATGVLLGSSQPNWYTFASGYKLAADLLAAPLGERGVVAEHVCLPILFLYRHFVELSLKALLLDLGELIDHVEPASPKHPLRPLWERFVTRLQATGVARPDSWLDQIGSWVLELDGLDSRSFTFRYPVDTAGKAMLAGGQLIDIGHVAGVMSEIAGIFIGAAEVIGQHLDIKRDLEDEFAGEYHNG